MRNVETSLQGLVDCLAAHRAVRAIGLSGGQRPLPEPGDGDIDLFVYCTEIPDRQEREEMLLALGGEMQVGKLESGKWGEGDCFRMAGVETWLLYFTLDEARAELEAVLRGDYPGRLDDYYYPIGRCAMWKTMRAYYDPDGFLESLKRSLDPYPETLARALVEHHLRALDDVEDLERAVRRRDVFFYHFALDLGLDHLLQALFAMNREYFPSRKRSESYLQTFKRQPSDCTARLRQVVALGGRAETLGQSYELWQDLVRQVRRLN